MQKVRDNTFPKLNVHYTKSMNRGNFRSPRGGTPQRRGSFRGRGGTPSHMSRMNLDFSGSDSYSDSSDLPTISTALTAGNPINMFSTSSDDEKSDKNTESSEEKPQVDWNSKTPKKPEQQQPRPPQKRKVRRPISKTNPPPKHEVIIPQKSEEVLQQEMQQKKQEQHEENINNDNDQTPSQEQQKPQTNITPQPSQPKIVPDEETFQIVYEQGKFLPNWKRFVQMTQNDILVFRAESKKVKPYGKTHIICRKPPCDVHSEYYAGMYVRHQSGARFTLYPKPENDQKPSQILGLSFINLDDDDANIRTFRIAISEESVQYCPTDKHDDLSRIAKKGLVVPDIKVYSSVLPKKNDDGSLTLDLGEYTIIRSTKNFIVRDSDNQPIFTLFKTFDGICTMKIRPPITPLMGFSIAIAIVTSTK